MSLIKKHGTKRIAALLMTLVLAVSSAGQVMAAEDSSEALAGESPSAVSDTADPENSGLDDTGEDSLPLEGEESEPSETESTDITGETTDTQPANADLPGLIMGTHDTYMSGYKDGTFRPDAFMTREEVALVVYNLLKTKPSAPTGQFTDVNDSGWSGTAINTLAHLKIISGDGNGKFRPGDNISRQEVVAIFARFFEQQSGTVPFTDVTQNWAYTSIVTAYVKGWIAGDGNGKFRPNDPIKRAEVTIIANRVLERTGDGFAADRGTQKFKDVPSTHGAYLDITEAATPVVVTEPPETTTYVKTTAVDGLRLRKEPSTTADTLQVLPLGTILTVVNKTSYLPWIQVKTSGGTTGYVHQDYVQNYVPGDSNGTATISTSSATLPQYKTLYLTGTVDNSTSNMVWTSSNTAVATVSNGFVYAVAPGTATISVGNVTGTSKASCTVTVSAAEAVRFTYSEPNTPAVGVAFELRAVTDDSKTAVKFVVSGAADGGYETTTYTTESQSAAGLPTNNVRVFKKEVIFNKAGSYTVRAYSKTGSGNWSAAYAENTLLVTTSGSKTVTTTESRMASTELINVLAVFEGYASTVYPDKLAYNIPTVGYGYVVSKNGTFYNNLTRTEAMAMLVDTVNNKGYSSAVEKFRSNNSIKMSQCQFDALVSFTYNLGAGSLSESYDTFKVVLNAAAAPSLPASGTVNIAATMYKSASAGSGTSGTIPVGTSVSVTKVERVTGNVNNLWYQVSYNGTTGWIRGGSVRFSGTQTRDLAYIDEQMFGSNLMQWNSAGGVRLPGLVYRRLGEAKIFCYANYADAYNSSANYRKNVGFDVPANVPGLALS